MTTPQGYKLTELGIIPEDWEVKSFSQIFDMYPNNTYPRDCMNDSCGVVRNIHYGDVLIKYPTIIDAAKCQMPYLNEDVKIRSHKVVQSGDVIIADTAEDDAVGKCVEVKNVSNEKIVAGLHTFFCHPVIPFASGWLGYYINSSNYHNQLLPYITGIKVSSISRASIQETKLLVPPIAEQRAIAEALSDVDGLIAALDKKIAKKRLLKQGAMQQLLTGKKRLPGFTDEWVSVQLKEICSFQNGYTPSKTVRHFWENGTVPWFRMEDIRTNGRILNHAIQHVTNAAVKGDLFPAGSIIMSTTATIGEHALLIVDSLANQQFTNLIIRKSLDKQVDTMWFYHYCYILGEWCRNNINDGGLAAVNMDDFSNVHITLPPILEQQAIATILSNMDKEIADLEAQRDKYRLLKSGMMQKLLTGQIRLKIE